MTGERAAAARNLLEALFRVLFRFPLATPLLPDNEGVKTSLGEAVKRPTEKRDFEVFDEAREAAFDTGLERGPGAFEGMLRE